MKLSNSTTGAVATKLRQPTYTPKQKTRLFAKNSIKASTKREMWAAVLFLAPITIGLLVFSFYPFVKNIYDSFFYAENLMTPQFVGFQNFIDLTTDEYFIGAMLNTFKYVIICVPLIVSIALFLSVLLNKEIRGKSFYRTIIFFPLVTTSAAVSMVWRWILNTNYGLANSLLMSLGASPIPWLTDEQYAFWACCLVIVWSSISFQTVVLLAGLQNISTVYYEAAEIDGVNSIQKFLRITLPLLSPTLYFVITVDIIAMFKQFDIVNMLIPAGPYNSLTPQIEASRSIVRYFYDIAFRDNVSGYPSAITIGMFVIILVVTIVEHMLKKKWVHDE